ncbi:MAG: hypothetical protein WC071_00260 [Victivallaceae bacterium]
MAEELQGLLEKIHHEGLKKADDEKDKIVAAAKKDAEKIIAQAKIEADGIRKKAEDDAASLEKRAKTAVHQAARDIILKLKDELQSRLSNIIRGNAEDAMTPEYMGGIILKMADAFNKNNDSDEPAIELLVAPKDLEAMQKLLAGSLSASFKTDPQLFPESDIGGGLKIGFSGNDVFFDFTDDAITDIIGEYVGPRLAEIIKQDKN